MKTYFLIAISLICIKANAQQDSIPVFKNQGEQDDYWAKEIFRKEYKKEEHSRYGKQIIAVNANTYQYGYQYFSIPELADSIKPLFTSGILYSSLFGANASGIGNIEELPFPELPPAIKRFSCWVNSQGFANPVVYVFELTNEQATKQTDLKSFIMGASLTFIKQGTIII